MLRKILIVGITLVIFSYSLSYGLQIGSQIGDSIWAEIQERQSDNLNKWGRLFLFVKNNIFFSQVVILFNQGRIIPYKN